jgi:hypothetical protein
MVWFRNHTITYTNLLGILVKHCKLRVYVQYFGIYSKQLTKLALQRTWEYSQQTCEQRFEK